MPQNQGDRLDKFPCVYGYFTEDQIALIFGDNDSSRYDELAEAGCFDNAASEKIFEDKNKGFLA